MRASFQQALEESRMAVGFRLLRLHVGPPVAAAKLDAIEREVLGVPMPKALRDFYLEMDGLQAVYVQGFEPGDEPFPPLVPEDPAPLSWMDTTSEFHGVWPAVQAATPADGTATIINIPDVETVFRHDWVTALGHPEVYWFDFFHHYYHAYLAVRDGEVVVGLAEDAGAALHEHAPISVGDYLRQVAAGTSGRIFGGRLLGEHTT